MQSTEVILASWFTWRLIASQVLTNMDHCYCVILNAHRGAAFPNDKETNQCSCLDNSSSEDITTTGKIKNPKVVLFSGFGSYQMVRDEYDAGACGYGDQAIGFN